VSLTIVGKADYSLIKISKEEAFALRKAFPDLEISRTVRQKTARGRFFVAEYPRVLRFLENYWNEKTIERWNPNA
jgi:hypothetical protein